MSVYFMPLETVMINVVEKVEKREHLYNVGGNMNCYSHCGKKIKNKTTMWSSNALLNIYSKEKKSQSASQGDIFSHFSSQYHSWHSK